MERESETRRNHQLDDELFEPADFDPDILDALSDAVPCDFDCWPDLDLLSGLDCSPDCGCDVPCG